MSLPTLALPGQPLAPLTKLSPGPGTHLASAGITSSLLGPPVTKKNTTTPKANKILSIQSPISTAIAPTVGSHVYARITRLDRVQARCEIITIAPPTSSSNSNSTGHVCATPLRSILRSQDVRATEKDKVKLAECFRVGDIVRAVVVGLGDQTGYYISTAGNEFGVVICWSDGGNLCVPVSWNEVLDQKTGVKEGRKVAKPF
ncbi:exosome component 1 [Venturia nashicola]|uniref:Exosome component 1 n=1 Tax=Venturia nashicola TaxID=86259 RepID=A0A4Z1NVT4_9PEZI|nr:exosome component 1 [Venturia nashicola]TLD29434.1 exosome component 1 [Venturia nashicola]